MEQKVFGKVLCQLLVTNGLSAYVHGKVILYKSHNEIFLWNIIWVLGQFKPAGQLRVHEFFVLFIAILSSIKFKINKRGLLEIFHRRTYMQWLCVHGYHLMHYKKCPPIIISASTLHWRHMSNNSYHYVWPIFDIFLSYWLTSKMPEILTHTNLSHFEMQDHHEN